MRGPPEAGVRSKFVADLGAGLGPFIMGYVFNMVLLGVLFAQVWHWRSWTVKERPLISIIVYWVLFWSIASSVFVIIWEWNLFVANYGTFVQFVDSSGTFLHYCKSLIPKLWLTALFSWLPVIDETVVFACQVFNLERSYRLNGSRIVVIILVLPFMLSTAGLIMARKIATSIQKNPEFNVTQLIQPPPQACLFTNVVTDVLLTLSIAFGLWKAKTGWTNTDNLLQRVLVQLPAAIAATATAVQFASNSKTTMVFLYMITNSKIPAVMFMAVLNYRFELQRDRPTTHVLSSSAGLINVETFDDATTSKVPYEQMKDIHLQEQPFSRYTAPHEPDGKLAAPL